MPSTSQKYIMSSSTILFTLTIIFCSYVNTHPVGFSYIKFTGPVSGPEKEIHFKDEHNGEHQVDYVAKPDYHFSYGVEDPKTNVLQNRKESRHGDTVTGEYSVVDANGKLRIVRYTADSHNGFRAEIIEDGKVTRHGHEGNGGGTGHTEPAHHETNSLHEDEHDDDSGGHDADESSENGGDYY